MSSPWHGSGRIWQRDIYKGCLVVEYDAEQKLWMWSVERFYGPYGDSKVFADGAEKNRKRAQDAADEAYNSGAEDA